jgi:type II secretory ATPase GspE/PulE/Tfp pilus assembly ATPase PilB-like protein
MRAFLRADPDVIMVGEMRDQETAAIAVEASLTGHLVLSTLHTNSAAETIVRMLELGLDAFNFSDALVAIVAQRLVKRVCGSCKQPHRATPSEIHELSEPFGGREGLAALGHPISDDLELYTGKGCESCNGTGYRGRAAIHELLVGTDELKHLILSRAGVPELLAQARRDGMTTLVQDGALKVLQGVTTFPQVRAVAIR